MLSHIIQKVADAVQKVNSDLQDSEIDAFIKDYESGSQSQWYDTLMERQRQRFEQELKGFTE